VSCEVAEPFQMRAMIRSKARGLPAFLAKSSRSANSVGVSRTLPTRLRHAPALQVDREIGELEALLAAPPARPAELGANSREQLGHRERLGHEVVGTEVERTHLVVSRSRTEITRIGIAERERMAEINAKPSITGIARSVSTRSGRRASIIRVPSRRERLE
jgi:hypothetical protein